MEETLMDSVFEKYSFNTEINYIGILHYLEKYRELPYVTPEKSGLTEEKKAEMLALKQRGQSAASEMKKIADLVGQVYGLDACSHIVWLDGSNTKTRKYLWAQLKYSDQALNPVSISIFAEVNGSPDALYRISLELKNDGASKEVIDKYHTHLDIPLNGAAGLVYVAGSNKWGRPDVVNDSQESIRTRLEELRKVQISGFIKQEPGKTNAMFQQEIMEAIRALLPYYNYVTDHATEQEEEFEVSSEFDKNMIFYGPPGTGKTYHTAMYAVAICEGKTLSQVMSYNYQTIMEQYNKFKAEGRIAFTTFHQSYGYEEFIEGIKPVVDDENSNLGYTIESGVFKRFCEMAEIPEQKERSFSGTIWNIRSRAGDSDVLFDYEEYLYNQGAVIVEDINDHKRQCNYIANLKPGDLVVLGRDYSISAIGIVIDETPEKIEKAPFYWKRKVNWLVKGMKISFADIGMAGSCVSNFAVAKSKIKFQNLKELIPQTTNNKPYVFVIDEINRGNISKIFGELITLIEDTKRKGMLEAASAILPYSGTEFAVPSNVYILGTMNTADRSIALMDTALRRRFQFIEMMPDASVLSDIGADHVDDLDVVAMLEKMNERIEFLYDREHTIGHAFFSKLAEHPDIDTLESIFEKSVIPLLQEYFYEDYQKIQLVLGDNGKTDPNTKFIIDENVKVKSIFKGNVEDTLDLPEKRYRINKLAFSNIESYKQII